MSYSPDCSSSLLPPSTLLEPFVCCVLLLFFLPPYMITLTVTVLLLFFDVQLKLCEGNPKSSNETTDNWSLVSSGLSALANMARDTYIRKRIADEQAWWETSVKFLVCITTLTSGSRNLLCIQAEWSIQLLFISSFSSMKLLKLRICNPPGRDVSPMQGYTPAINLPVLPTYTCILE